MVTILRCLDVEGADAIDEILAAAAFDFARVDRARLHESYEAWVHVRLDPPDPDRIELFFVWACSHRCLLLEVGAYADKVTVFKLGTLSWR